MFKVKYLASLILILLTTQVAIAQLGFSHEIGVIAGPVAFKSDFGERYDFETNAGNTGVGLGLVHFMNFAYRAACNCYTKDNYFNDHFKIRTEISWNKTTLEHLGEFADPSKTSIEAQKLRAHKGEANNLDIGMQLEYYPFSLRDFQGLGSKFAPFLSLGTHYVSFNPKTTTTFGDGVIDENNYYARWFTDIPDPENAMPIALKSGATWSMVGSIGTRYKLNKLSDIMIDLRGQFYFSDWVDGLNHKLEYNQYKDWLVWLNFGYIYYFD